MKAVALDIDGVILKGGKLIAGADDAIRRLKEEKVPFVLLTNGGGIPESIKANELSKKIGIDLLPSQVILCHSPFQDLVEDYHDSPVLILGKPDCLEVARSYGFTNPIGSHEYYDRCPGILPVKPHSSHIVNDVQFFPEICAVFVFHDPVDWTLDMQILSDVLVDHSQIPKKQKIPMYASNADIVYATEYPFPRFTQGAFVESFRHLFQLYHQIPLSVTYFGKPFDIQYKYAEKYLVEEANRLDLERPAQFFGVGDNPKSDIKGKIFI
jgi:HAD superfamily hydrolase (TIGR01456 family)